MSSMNDRVLLLPDKVVSYIDSLAKKAAAFFKMSRSIFSRWTSFRRFLQFLFFRAQTPLAGEGILPGFLYSSIC